jgi:hypothetical protein
VRGLRAFLLGAALTYFFDPQNGTGRRKALIKRLARLRRDPVKPDLDSELAGQAQAVAAD